LTGWSVHFGDFSLGHVLIETLFFESTYKDMVRLKCVVVLISLSALFDADAFGQNPVTVYGELRAIMQRGDLSPKVSLDTMMLKPTTMGLGVVAGLKGEIIVVNGKFYNSSVENGSIVSNNNDSVRAAMLVTTLVGDNRDLLIAEIQSMAWLESILKPYSTGDSFAFLIKANESDIIYHVIDWKDGARHTPDNHKQFAVKGKIENSSVIIVGFYSEQPGIFTPHTSKIHLHVFHPETGIVGHVEELKTKKTLIEIY
jgi:acetolactate decarboxylase